MGCPMLCFSGSSHNISSSPSRLLGALLGNCPHLRSYFSVFRSKTSWAPPSFPFHPAQDCTVLCMAPLPLEAALQLPPMPPMPSMCHLDAFDSQHAAAGLGLMMPSASSPAATSVGPIAAHCLAIPGLGLEVHSSEATVRSLGGCFLSPLVLVATSDRTREHLVLRI